jgi:hypothetical protein
LLGVQLGLTVVVTDIVPVLLGVNVPLTLDEAEGDIVTDGVTVREIVPVVETEGVGHDEIEAENDPDAVKLDVTDTVTDGVTEGVPDMELLPLGDEVTESVTGPVPVTEWEGVLLGDTLMELDPVKEGEGEGDGTGVMIKTRPWLPGITGPVDPGRTPPVPIPGREGFGGSQPFITA